MTEAIAAAETGSINNADLSRAARLLGWLYKTALLGSAHRWAISKLQRTRACMRSRWIRLRQILDALP